MLTGEVKQRLIQVLTEMVERHRRARAAVTDEVSLLHSLCEAYLSSSSSSKSGIIAFHLLIMTILFVIISFMSGVAIIINGTIVLFLVK